MDIEAFYDQDERRRESAEYEFGDGWSDASGTTYELSWVEATGELYLMSEPDAQLTEDAFGDFVAGDTPVGGLQVVVVAKVTSLDALENALDGWEEAMENEDSLAWLRERFPAA
jgi:hypothetical protein